MRIKSDIKNVTLSVLYGRGTAIKVLSINLLAVLPRDLYEKYEKLKDNSQSVLLHEMKDFLIKAYPEAHINEGHLLIPSYLIFEFILVLLLQRTTYTRIFMRVEVG